MHIPDGYLGPPTYLAAYALAAPFWAAASRIVGRTLSARQVPLLAIGAAFSFVIMMFNIPFAGTTGHAVGAVLLAMLLGPWGACIAVSIALLVQALLFGDGGITTLGANCLNLAVIMPFVGFGLYRLLSARSDKRSRRRLVAGGMGAYLGLNAAAAMAALMLGLQPLIAHGPGGEPRYAPFPLHIAFPALMAPHLLIFGLVEAFITVLALAYFQKTEPELIR